MKDLTDSVSAYISALGLERLAKSPGGRNVPEQERFPAAVLFVDISGFTTFTERLDTGSPEGIEALADILNDTFSNLISFVYECGGDVVKFAGDALWAIWKGEEKLDTAVWKAMYCARKIQEHYPVKEGNLVSLRASLTAGDISVLHVGGVFGRWEMIIAGKPLISLGIADKKGIPGDVVYFGEISSSLAKKITGKALGDGCYRVDTVIDPHPEKLTKYINEEFSQGLRGYIPGAILKRLDAGQADWLNEIRTATIVFLRLTGMNYDLPGSLEKAHEFMRKLQQIIYHHEGSLNRLNVDDKGTIMLAAFGLPPLSHEDDALRAMKAMWEVRKEIVSMGYNISIGVTSGRAFCGALGNEYRREYTMHGDVVNMSARLMQKASEGWGLLCDEATYQSARDFFNFEVLESVPLKGKRQLSNLYCPRSPVLQMGKTFQPVSGRLPELSVILERINLLNETRQGGIIILKGEAGMGKSMLIQTVFQKSHDMKHAVILLSGSPVEPNTDYYAIRKLIRDMLISARRSNSLYMSDKNKEHLYLLNEDFGVNFEKESYVKDIRYEDRENIIQGILLDIVDNLLRQKPVLVIVEESRWVDEKTWNLLSRIMEKKPGLLLLVSARPFTLRDRIPALFEDPDSIQLTLESMDDNSILELAAAKMGGTRMEKSLETFIINNAGGHPLFAAETARSLLHNQCVHINKGGLITLNVKPEILEKFQMTDSIRGLITERIDRLSAVDQLVLKVAGVTNSVFSFQMIFDIFPVRDEVASLEDSLRHLVDSDFLIVSSSGEHSVYAFKHSLVRDVAESMILFSQRKFLHRKIAEWYEKNEPDASESYSILAYHYAFSGDYRQAVQYLNREGAILLKSGRSREALQRFRYALGFIKSHSNTFEKQDLLFVRRSLAAVYNSLSLFRSARKQLQAILIENGYKLKPVWMLRFFSVPVELISGYILSFCPGRLFVEYTARKKMITDTWRDLALESVDFGQKYSFSFFTLRARRLDQCQDDPHKKALSQSLFLLALSQLKFNRLARMALHSLEKKVFYDFSVSDENTIYNLSLYYTSKARWVEVQRTMALILDEDSPGREKTYLYLSGFYRIQGDFEKSENYIMKAAECMDSHSNPSALVEAYLSLAVLHYYRKRYDRALEYLDLPLLKKSKYTYYYATLMRRALKTAVLWRKGDNSALSRGADSVFRLLDKGYPFSVLHADFYSVFTELLIGLSDKRAARFLRRFRQFSKIHPVALSRYYYCRALYELGMRHDEKEATRKAEKSLKISTSFDLPYDSTMIRERFFQIDSGR